VSGPPAAIDSIALASLVQRMRAPRWTTPNKHRKQKKRGACRLRFSMASTGRSLSVYARGCSENEWRPAACQVRVRSHRAPFHAHGGSGGPHTSAAGPSARVMGARDGLCRAPRPRARAAMRAAPRSSPSRSGRVCARVPNGRCPHARVVRASCVRSPEGACGGSTASLVSLYRPSRAH